MDFEENRGTEQEKNRYNSEQGLYQSKKCIWCLMEKKYGIRIPNHCECESS